TVTLIPNGIHHPPIEDGRLLPNSVKSNFFRLLSVVSNFGFTFFSVIFIRLPLLSKLGTSLKTWNWYDSIE
ncbi:hypothetical protein, partial [Enterococcus faecium]|uniref:hypothetical protein n=1 Tax=Enterococcus faecium TaxID=1352 RepID=UPI001C9282E9